MKEEYQIFLSKVPALRSIGKVILTIIYIFSLITLSILYFYYIDPIMWFMPIATQSLMALIVVIIAYKKSWRCSYINSTEMLFPFKRILGFLKLLFFF